MERMDDIMNNTNQTPVPQAESIEAREAELLAELKAIPFELSSDGRSYCPSPANRARWNAINEERKRLAENQDGSEASPVKIDSEVLQALKAALERLRDIKQDEGIESPYTCAELIRVIKKLEG